MKFKRGDILCSIVPNPHVLNSMIVTRCGTVDLEKGVRSAYWVIGPFCHDRWGGILESTVDRNYRCVGQCSNIAAARKFFYAFYSSDLR